MSSKRWVVGAGALICAGIIAAAWWIHHGSASVAPAISGERGARVAPLDDPASLADPRHDGASSSLDESASASGRAEISTRRDLRVRVVDAARRPLANVPVALAAVGAREQHGGVVVRTRAPDGIAPFVAEDSSLRRELSDSDWCVYLAFPGAGPQFVRVSRADPPAEPIEFVAPDVGRLVVKIDGARIEARGEMQLFGWPAGTKPSPDMRSSAFPFRFPYTGAGELIVDPIATGLRLDVEVWLEQYAVVSVRGDGPRRAGETATLTAVMRRFGPIVTGRLVGTDGAPFAHQQLTGFVVDDPASAPRDAGVDVTTDADGGFRFDASGSDVEGEPRTRHLELYAGRTGVAGRARAALPAVFVEGEYDVGRVTFETAPLVVSGRVVDSVGSPVAGAVVHVCRAVSVTNDGLRGIGPGNFVCTVNDASGAFESYGFAEGALIAFAADEQRRESAPVHFTSGRRDVNLVLRGTGALEGSFAQYALLDLNQIVLSVRRADGDGADGPLYAPISPANGRFRWKRLAAGRMDVVIALGKVGEHPEIVHVVRDVEVEADEVNHPEQLAGIDLRPYITRLEFEVVDPDGAPVPHGTVSLLSVDGGREPVLTVPFSAGKATVSAPKRVVDVDVRAAGFRRERRLGLTSGARVELRRALPVRLVLDPPFETDGANVSVALVLFTTGSADAGADHQRIVFDPGLGASFRSSESGSFQVGLDAFTILPPADGTPRDQDVSSVERWKAAQQRLTSAFGRPTCAITEDNGEQRLMIPLSPAARAIMSELLRDFRETPK